MKKLLTIMSSILVTATPLLTVTSCRLFSVYRTPGDQNHPKNPAYNDPIDDSNNNRKKVKTFTYENIKYTISDEDTANPTNVYYANQVLENGANEFKKLIPNAKDYDIKNLASEQLFPTIASLSQYIRSLEHFNADKPDLSHFMFKAKDNKTYIDATTHQNLVKKVLEIVNQQQELIKIITNATNLVNENKNASIESVREQLGYPEEPEKSDSRLWGISSRDLFNDKSWKGTYSWKEIPFDTRSDNFYNFGKDGLLVIPTGLWYYNRLMDVTDNFNNVLFLSKQFFEKSDEFNPKKMRLTGTFIDQMLRNKIKVYTMQEPQLELLLAFLELQQALTDSSLISDENKTLKEQFEKSGIMTKIAKFEDKVLEYLKVKQLVGFNLADDMSDDISLQMFPGTDFYETYLTDFRATYKFAWNEYHKVVQPLMLKFFGSTTTTTDFNQAFNKEPDKNYYDFIWKNIKHVDKLDAPHLISKQLAETRFTNFVNYYKTRFNWKFNKIDE